MLYTLRPLVVVMAGADGIPSLDPCLTASLRFSDTTPFSPPQELAMQRIRQSSLMRIVLLLVEVRGDTLVGVRGDGKAHQAYQRPDLPTQLNVPMSELTSVEIERLNVLRTVGLGMGVAVGTGLMAYGMKAAGDAAEDLCFGAFC